MSHQHDDDTGHRLTRGNYIATSETDDGVDRRGFLRCMAWAGTAMRRNMRRAASFLSEAANAARVRRNRSGAIGVRIIASS